MNVKELIKELQKFNNDVIVNVEYKDNYYPATIINVEESGGTIGECQINIIFEEVD